MSIKLHYRQNPDFPHRYISPEKLFFYLEQNFSDQIEQIGISVLGNAVYRLSLGKGSIKVIAWSQMHGNESNATHAMLDFLEIMPNLDDVEDLFSNIQLDFIFMLNPDGSKMWTRRNAINIDMNRDFLKRSSKEIDFLIKALEEKSYDYALNLHEQRTIFTTDGKHPATLSFLAPSPDQERTITEPRKKAMAVIARSFGQMKNDLPNRIARYTDEFYPTALGDNLMKKGVTNILFEGGHFEDDYLRHSTRKFYTIALYETLKAIAFLDGKSTGWKDYENIPLNKETHYDIIYRNVQLNTDYECILDVAVQYKEEYKEGDDEITFTPIVVEVGDVGTKKGWKEIDCTGLTFKSDRKFPKIDSEVDFTFE